MDGVSFAAHGVKGALDTQANAISQLLRSAADSAPMASATVDSTFRASVMNEFGVGSKINIVA